VWTCADSIVALVNMIIELSESEMFNDDLKATPSTEEQHLRSELSTSMEKQLEVKALRTHLLSIIQMFYSKWLKVQWVIQYLVEMQRQHLICHHRRCNNNDNAKT
jgi:hypothetical protein